MHFGGGQAEVSGDVPACGRGELPVGADAAMGESRCFGGQPGDVERPVRTSGDALDQRAAHGVRHGVYGEGVQRKGCVKDWGATGQEAPGGGGWSGPGEGVADRRREVVLLAVVGDVGRSLR
ncbi:hypothetical protein GCM10017688_15500 [Streptomyces ramulosus]